MKKHVVCLLVTEKHFSNKRDHLYIHKLVAPSPLAEFDKKRRVPHPYPTQSSQDALQLATSSFNPLSVQVCRAVRQKLVTVSAGDAPVLAGLLGNISDLVVREVAHVLGRVARPELSRRNTTSRRHDAASCKDRVGLDEGTIENDRAHANERIVLNGARVERAAMADSDVVANVCAWGQARTRGARCVDDCTVLHVRAVANTHLIEVASDHDVVEDRGIVADLNVAYDRGVWSDPHVVGDLRTLVVQSHDLTVARNCIRRHTYRHTERGQP